MEFVPAIQLNEYLPLYLITVIIKYNLSIKNAKNLMILNKVFKSVIYFNYE